MKEKKTIDHFELEKTKMADPQPLDDHSQTRSLFSKTSYNCMVKEVNCRNYDKAVLTPLID